jgi:membrane protein implicated in regulation of membrane protease activity
MIWVWLALIIVTFIIEALTMDLVSIWFTAAGIGALISALLDLNLIIQLVVFIVIAGVLLLWTRPLAKKALAGRKVKTNADMVVGQIAVVTEKITRDDRGAVKIQGKEWTAITDEEEILPGERVTVLAIDGVKLVVRKNEEE